MKTNDPAGAEGRAQRLRELADRYGSARVEVVSDDMLDSSLVADLPVEWARANGLLPVRIEGRACVLTAEPDEVSRLEDLALLLGQPLTPVLAAPSEIARGIERCYYQRESSPSEFILDIGASEDAPAPSKADDLLQVAQQAPVTQLVNLILLEAVKRGASDIHFELFESRLRVRYRIDGVLYEQASPPKNLEQALVSRLKVMAHMDIAERRLPQDGMARVRVGDHEIDIRVSSVPVAEGERLVLRLLKHASMFLSLSDLGMGAATLERFESLLTQPSGIIVVSGPTGSGKTTTLYAALGCMDASRKNIMTIEDPVEYQLPDIGQMQVKPKIGLTFASGLRHILRQDPDVILVGETRDAETAQIAIRASLTGHIVFTTLHTNDAPGAVLRLLDMGIEPYLLASCLRGVLAQRLVRRLCGACRARKAADAGTVAALGAVGLTPADVPEGFSPVGCPACLEGFSGRTGLFELMTMDRDLQQLVRSGSAGADRLRALAETRGMGSLLADGLDKVRRGETSLDEVLSTVASL